MFSRNTKKSFKKLKYQELLTGKPLDAIILDLLNYQVQDTSQKDTPPFIIKKEYQDFLLLPYESKKELLTLILK